MVLVLLFVALWFILRGDFFYVLPCVTLFLCYSVLLAFRLPRFGKRELILVLFVRLFDVCLFGFVGSSWCLGRAASCDCGTPKTFLLTFFCIIRGDLFHVLPCVILFLCFSFLLALRLPRLGKRELILVLFVRLFDVCFFRICRFPLPLGVWEGLRFVIVAVSGHFSYPLFYGPMAQQTTSARPLIIRCPNLISYRETQSETRDFIFHSSFN